MCLSLFLSSENIPPPQPSPSSVAAVTASGTNNITSITTTNILLHLFAGYENGEMHFWNISTTSTQQQHYQPQTQHLKFISDDGGQSSSSPQSSAQYIRGIKCLSQPILCMDVFLPVDNVDGIASSSSFKIIVGGAEPSLAQISITAAADFFRKVKKIESGFGWWGSTFSLTRSHSLSFVHT